MTDFRTSGTAPAPIPPPVTDEGPRGIGGWLILPIIGLGLTIVLTFKELVAVGADREAMAGFQLMLSNNASGELRTLLYYVMADVGAAIALIGLAAICLTQIVRMRRTVPEWMTWFYIAAIVCCLVDLYVIDHASDLTTSGDPDSDGVRAAGQVIGSTIRAAIWIPYFWISKRVKNTFVN